MNRDLNADFCGKVPLNQTNLIQPHGVLLIVALNDLTILQVSENIHELLGVPATEVAGTALSRYITPEEMALLQERFSKPIATKIPFTFTFTQHGVLKKLLALVQQQQGYYIIELEKDDGAENRSTFLSVYQELRFVMAAIESADAVEAVAQITATELKRLSGFDKVMIYRFDDAWNGTVIAEALEQDMESYLGLKFPASDIPKQARDMYRRNPYRFIPDAEYEPVRLYPVLNPVTGGFTDLTDSNLRSVAGVHVEYLRNMQVRASMSTRIVVNGQLWGLISCHHRTAKKLSYQSCSMFELLSNVVSAKVAALDQAASYAAHAELQVLYTQLVAQLYNSASLSEGLYQLRYELLKMLRAEGVAVVLNHEVQTIGETPRETEVQELVYWLQANNTTALYHTAHLAAVHEEAGTYAAVASGLLALPVQPVQGSYILAFRPEVVRQVSWGGNPNDAITFEPNGKQYHPRQSFSQWKEIVHQQALPWTNGELQLAEQFRNVAIGFALHKM